VELKDWFGRLEANVKKAQDAGEDVGACLIADPNGGPPVCVLVDRQTCTGTLQGTFLGGDCGE
jgi:hypothetical protein